jgi:hypothetical protein
MSRQRDEPHSADQSATGACAPHSPRDEIEQVQAQACWHGYDLANAERSALRRLAVDPHLAEAELILTRVRIKSESDSALHLNGIRGVRLHRVAGAVPSLRALASSRNCVDTLADRLGVPGVAGRA